MQIFNIMTCSSPPHTWGTGIMSGCSQAWLAIAFVFILVLILRRQSDDGILAGTSYNVIGAGVVGVGAAILLITFFGAAKWAILGGLGGIALGGFGLGLLGIGGDGGSE